MDFTPQESLQLFDVMTMHWPDKESLQVNTKLLIKASILPITVAYLSAVDIGRKKG